MAAPPLSHPDDRKTIVWWTILRSIAVFNIFAWMATWWLSDSAVDTVRANLVLSAIFTLVCAFRSFWPRIDLERTALVDSPLSSMVAGRSAATIAEVSFATQVALYVRQIGIASGMSVLEDILPWLIVALLATAQAFCWSSVINLNHLGHAIEESIWGGTFAMVTVAMIWAVPQLEGPLFWITAVSIPGCIAYVIFMVVVDVPMYVKRWRAGRRNNERVLGLAEGFADALYRREPTRSWAVWKPEVAWLTGYFSFAVWASLGMVFVAAL